MNDLEMPDLETARRIVCTSLAMVRACLLGGGPAEQVALLGTLPERWHPHAVTVLVKLYAATFQAMIPHEDAGEVLEAFEGLAALVTAR